LEGRLERNRLILDKTVAIILARRGSKQIPGKNWRPLLGKPLVRWSVEQALAAESIDRVVVTSDAPEVMDAIEGQLIPWGQKRSSPSEVTWVARPEHLATDTATTESAVSHALDTVYGPSGPFPDVAVILQPTSPLRRPGDIDACVELLKGYDSVVSVVRDHRIIPGELREMRQAQMRVIENGAVYAMRTDTFLVSRNRICGMWEPFLMPEWTRYEIDAEDDFAIVEMLMEKYMVDATKTGTG
jgi:CMP-N,N'-diacetyllegionaminic acid synthase